MAITRTHFAYRIDLWTDDEKEVVEHLADVDDLTVALATYHAAIERWPGKAITLRQGRHVIEDSRRSRLASLFSFPWSDKPPPERARKPPRRGRRSAQSSRFRLTVGRAAIGPVMSGPLGRERTSPALSHAPYVELAKLGFIAPFGESTDPAVIAHNCATGPTAPGGAR